MEHSVRIVIQFLLVFASTFGHPTPTYSDLGYADSLVNIVNEYFDKYFPDAIKFAKELKVNYEKERLVFTTHSYLIWLYLNCPVSSGLHCPNETSVKEFTEAVRAGDIVWHAYPFNAQPEVYDRLMAGFGIRFTMDISEQLGVDFKPNTMSQRDVPGLTRSMIPILVNYNIKAITVGVNPASMPPALPSAFKWVDKISDTQILAMWHPFGYGGQSGVGADSMVVVPGMSAALAFGIRGDNIGPPSVSEVVSNFAKLKSLYPNAEIVASGYNDFVEELDANNHLLEEYTEEVGDTWIHGVASDPWKTVQFREMLRIRSDCLGRRECTLDDPRFYNFSVFLLKYGEHTWGEDVKKHLNDFVNWSDSSFHPLMYSAKNYVNLVKSWTEQRTWSINYALNALGNHPIKQTILQNIAELHYNGVSPLDAHVPANCSSLSYGSITIGFDEDTMAITSLKDSRGSSSLEFAGGKNQLGQLVYSVFNQSEIDNFLAQYLCKLNNTSVDKNFGKPGMNVVHSGFSVSPKAKACWKKIDKNNAVSFIVHGAFDDRAISDFGAAADIWLEVMLPKIALSDEEVPINMTLYLSNKTSTRVPESLSLFFHPNLEVVDSSKMVVSKLGQRISVLDVIKNGSKHVHSTDEGIQYNGKVPLRVKAWDTNVVTIGGTNPFPVPMETPDVNNGFAFNIFNNLWDTNYIMWYPYQPTDESSKYRFTLTLPPV